jgi:hypothetical protein
VTDDSIVVSRYDKPYIVLAKFHRICISLAPNGLDHQVTSEERDRTVHVHNIQIT